LPEARRRRYLAAVGSLPECTHWVSRWGLRIPFERDTVGAPSRLYRSAWYCLMRTSQVDSSQAWALPGEPRTPSHHYPPDLFRYRCPFFNRRYWHCGQTTSWPGKLADCCRRCLSASVSATSMTPLVAADFAVTPDCGCSYADSGRAREGLPGFRPVRRSSRRDSSGSSRPRAPPFAQALDSLKALAGPDEKELDA